MWLAGGRLDAGDTRGECYYGLNSRDGGCKVGSLRPGAFASYSLNVYPQVIGGYAMTVAVDPDDRIRENSNRNNITVIPIPVTR